MKYLFCIVSSVTFIPFPATSSTDHFQIIIKSMWQDLEPDDKACEQFGSKWILVGTITFKKKSKEPVELNQLLLQWKGDKLDNLTGSLYIKNNNEEFMPIEDHLICDSAWNKKNQTLLLKFDSQQTLGFINTFYLVLTIPLHTESSIKKGYFNLDHQCLPDQFKCCNDNGLCLYLS